jgi:hypothetical protein
MYSCYVPCLRECCTDEARMFYSGIQMRKLLLYSFELVAELQYDPPLVFRGTSKFGLYYSKMHPLECTF